MPGSKTEPSYEVRVVGYVRSPLKNLEDCPLQGEEGAPEAWIELCDEFLDGIQNLETGSEVVLITWFHEADRSVLKCIRRREFGTPAVGVFSTRSPDRPNPIGLHQVRVVEITGKMLTVFPLEALDGTPVIDIKPLL